MLPNLGSCLNPLVDIVGAPWAKTQPYSIAVTVFKYFHLIFNSGDKDNIIYAIHADEIFSEIDFLVASYRGDRYLSDAFGPMKKYCS